MRGRSGTGARTRRARLSRLCRARGGISDEQAGDRSRAALSLLLRSDARQGRAAPRAAGGAAFSEFGLPNRRVESWHYTDLKAAMGRPAPLAAAARAASALPRAGSDSLRLVTLDGPSRMSRISPTSRRRRRASLRDALAQGAPHSCRARQRRYLRAGSDPRAQCGADAGRRGHSDPAGRGARPPIELATSAPRKTHSRPYASLVMLGAGAQATVSKRSARLRRRRAGQCALVLHWRQAHGSISSLISRAATIRRSESRRCSRISTRRRRSIPSRCSKARGCCAVRYSRGSTARRQR